MTLSKKCSLHDLSQRDILPFVFLEYFIKIPLTYSDNFPCTKLIVKPDKLLVSVAPVKKPINSS